MSTKYFMLMVGLVVVLVGTMAVMTMLLPAQVGGGIWYIPRPAAANTFVIIDQGQERTVVRKDPERGPAGLALVTRGDYWLRPFGVFRPGIEGFIGYLTSYITLLVLSMVLLYLFPQRIRTMAEAMQENDRQRVSLILIGVIGVLGAAVLSLLLWLNVVLTPLVLLIIPVVVLGLLLGLIAVSVALGRAFLGRIQGGPAIQVSQEGEAMLEGVATISATQALIAGMTLLYLVSLLPYLVGWVIVGIAAIFGFGALIGTRLGTGEAWSLDEWEL
jgi:hypothetical protein